MPVRIEMLPVYIAIGISAILAVSASFMRLLTVPAAITAAVMLTAAAVFWGFTGMTLYLALFALSSLIGAVGGKRRKERVMRIHKRTGARKVVQVLANGLPALVMAAIWFFTGLVPFKVAAAASLAAGFADSVAGDVGVLSRGKTVSVLGFRRVERGMSGGITLAGSIATVLASALGAAIPAFFGEYGAALFGVGTLGAAAGCTLDSVLGASVQALYRCGECGRETERTECCGKPTELVRGFGFINNDAVNCVAVTFAAVVGGAIAATIIYIRL